MPQPRVAALSLSAMIPIAGELGEAGKVAKDVEEGAEIARAAETGERAERVIGRYGDLKAPEGFWKHHILPNAAVEGDISKADGIAIGLKDGLSQGAEHRMAHANLERFFDKYREGGPFEGETPTYRQLLEAGRTALEEAGVSRADAERAYEMAREQLKELRLTDKRIPQVPRATGIR